MTTAPTTSADSNPGQNPVREREILTKLGALVEEVAPLVQDLTEIVPSDTDPRAAPLLGLAQSLAAARHFLAEYQQHKIAPQRRLELLGIFVSIAHAIAVQAFNAWRAEPVVVLTVTRTMERENLTAAIHDLRKAHRSIGALLGRTRA